MRLVYQQNDGLAFERIINVPRRGVGASTIAQFHAHSQERGVSLYAAASEMLKSGHLRAGLRKTLAYFFELIEFLREQPDMPPKEIAKVILDRTGYLATLDNEHTLEAQGRAENIKELLVALDEFTDLRTFIEHVSLVVDSHNPASDRLISIMTLHSAKGLEFDAVFLTGWEEGIFPHNLSLQEGNLEEERRLAYVGITRARKYAFISHAKNRKVYNQWQSNMPSRFLAELAPEHVIQKFKQPRQ
jgi:DNA helicase-2/ATP-dependent DNA helicase PcrA